MNEPASRKRMLEIIPGALVWITFTLAIVLSIVQPVWVMIFVIIFDLYWLFRVVYFLFYLLLAWAQYRRDRATDWFGRVLEVTGASEIIHVIFLPTFREELPVIRATLASLATAHYPLRNMIVVLAGEEADQKRFQINAEAVRAEFGHTFRALLTTVHPHGLPDEIPGKGSNINYAGHVVQAYLDKEKIPYDRVMASSFDVDTIAHPDYFACLSVKFFTEPNPLRASYQPVALYNNNLWQAPGIVRIASFGTTFWLLSELVRPDRMMTFSSHSMPFQMLVDVGFWQKDVVSEDSRIFLQGLLQYRGDYRVIPIFLPVSMDAVQGKTFWKSLGALYRQQRRWAWGVEHFPFLITEFSKLPEIPRWTKFRFLWRHLEGMYTWATVPVLIFVLGRLPLLVAPKNVQLGTLFQNTPYTLQTIMNWTMVGILVSACLSLLLLPPREDRRRLRAAGVMLLSWIMLPITFVVFGSFPAVDAQTRLMFGRYLGFNVTEKKRV